MKSYDPAISAYRAAGKAHGQISFLSFKVKALNDPESLTWAHFCTADDNMTVTVTDPETGDSDERTFAGGGHIVSLGELTRSERQIIRSHTLVLSGASDTVLDMVFGYNCRQAPFQWFIGETDEATGLLIAEPALEFDGFVNTMDVSDSALPINGGDGANSTLPVTVDSHGAALTARNFDMRVLDVSQQRSGDKFFRWVGNAHHWRRWWGKEKKSKRDRKGGRGKKD